jgi:stage III sporulation protein AE
MKRALIFIIFVIMLTSPCHADLAAEQAEVYGITALEQAEPPSARAAVGDMKISAASDVKNILDSIWCAVKKSAADELRSAGSGALSVLMIVVICSMLASVFDGGRLPEYITLAGCLAIAYTAVNSVWSLVSMSSDTLNELSDFSKVLLPTMCTVAASAGAVTSASAKYAATALFMDMLITAANKIVVPLIYAYIASIIAGAAIGSKGIAGVSKLIKWFCTVLMTAITTAFAAYLSLTGAITGAADAAAVKATKTAVSAALPVVGSIISDAASSIVAGAGLLRGAVGIFGMTAICAACAAPFAALGLRYLLYKAVAACTAVLPSGRLSELVGGIGTAYGMLLGLIGCGGIMLFLSVISSVKAVGL